MASIRVEIAPDMVLCVHEHKDHISRLDWSGRSSGQSTALLKEAEKQLRAYFKGRLRRFDLPLAPQNTDFQKRVLAAMSAIPYGQTRTYGQLASEIKTAARAVGNACGANSIPILIPCHRVLGAKGLCGYSGAGGLDTKLALLRLENPQFVLV